MTEYITNADYRRQKSGLTRAINSGDPLKVLDNVEKTLNEWSGKAWPDGWARWRNAVEDARWTYTRSPEWSLPMPETLSRFDALLERLG
jgi:hypothetical protein